MTTTIAPENRRITGPARWRRIAMALLAAVTRPRLVQVGAAVLVDLVRSGF